MKKYLILTIIFLFIIFIIRLFRPSKQTTSAIYDESEENLDFFVIADPHYLSKKNYDNGEAFKDYLNADDKLLQYSKEFLYIVKDDIDKIKPNFIVVAGDLTCNGCRESHYDVSNILREFESKGTKVYVIPGNHDISNSNARCYYKDKVLNAETINREDFLNIYKEFGYDDAISLDKHSLSYLVKPLGDIYLLMLDTTNDFPDQGGSIKTKTFDWIIECSKQAEENNSKIIVVMHHSLMNHSKIINKGYTLYNSVEALQVFHECKFDLVLTGHIHLQDIKTNTKDSNKIYDIATSSLIVYPYQYGHMKYLPSIGYEYNTIQLDVVEYGKKNKIRDKNLLEFKEYSDTFFKTQCCKMQKKCIESLDKLNKEEKEEVIKIVSEINKMYFAGYRNEKLDELKNTNGFKILENIPTCPIKEYVMEILNDERSNNNKISIPLKK